MKSTAGKIFQEKALCPAACAQESWYFPAKTAPTVNTAVPITLCVPCRWPPEIRLTNQAERDSGGQVGRCHVQRRRECSEGERAAQGVVPAEHRRLSQASLKDDCGSKPYIGQPPSVGGTAVWGEEPLSVPDNKFRVIAPLEPSRRLSTVGNP
jgi:hypothetical protein